jgi:hypothetical protein
MRILEVKRSNQTKGPLDLTDDHRWILGRSYRSLLMHFRQTSVRNRLHNGAMGKFFSDTINAKAAELGDEARAILDEVNGMTDPVTIKNTVH